MNWRDKRRGVKYQHTVEHGSGLARPLAIKDMNDERKDGEVLLLKYLNMRPQIFVRKFIDLEPIGKLL